jgi:hypothetical protein
MRKPKATAPACITPKCSRTSITRGLCSSCYATATQLVVRGEATWDQLQDMKLIAVKKVRSPFMVAFNARKPSGKVSIPISKRVGS